MRQKQYEQLVDCFKKVFPNVGGADISSISQESTAAWDSIAHITLISLIGEEFGMDLDFEDFEDATSFSAVHDVLDAKLSRV